jgi:hypothetical protein
MESTFLVAIRREERQIEKQLRKAQHRLDGIRAAAARRHWAKVRAKAKNATG